MQLHWRGTISIAASAAGGGEAGEVHTPQLRPRLIALIHIWPLSSAEIQQC